MGRTTRLLVMTVFFATLTALIAVPTVVLTIDQGLGWERFIQLVIVAMGLGSTIRTANRWLKARESDREARAGLTNHSPH